jgi:hypothetical protein
LSSWLNNVRDRTNHFEPLTKGTARRREGIFGGGDLWASHHDLKFITNAGKILSDRSFIGNPSAYPAS